MFIAIYILLFAFDLLDKIERLLYNKCILMKGVIVLFITATELKTNLGKYLPLSSQEDIFITKNGKTIAKLTNPYKDKLDTVGELFGCLPPDITLSEAREERRAKL